MNYITETMSWIGKNILDIALVFVGASAFITYKLQVKKEQKTAATLVVKQIQDIESIIKPLKSAKQLNGEMIYRCKQIITKNYWNEYRHFLLKDMKDSYLSKIEEFYSNAEELEKSRASICNELSNTFNNKASSSSDKTSISLSYKTLDILGFSLVICVCFSLAFLYSSLLEFRA